MDNAVVDGSVAMKWFVTEQYSPEARRLLNEGQTGKLSILVPDLFYAEVGNFAWKKQEFQGLLPIDAQRIIDEIGKLQLTVTPCGALLADAYRHAVTYHCSVYDGMYVALCVRENCRLVTADQKLINKLGPGFANVVWIGNWP